MLLRDKVAIISGGSRGIGRAIALEFASQGASIAFNYFQSKEEAMTLENEIIKEGGKGKAFQVDIRNAEATTKWVEAVRNQFGRLDIVVNNAGISRDMTLMMMDKKEWDEVIETNLGGVYNLTRAVIVGLMKQKSGSIINIVSVSGMVGVPGQTNYSASKAGIIGFTKSLAKEAAPRNVRVNAIAPGYIETDMLGQLKEKYKPETLIGNIPLHRFGTPKDIAKVALFFASDNSSYVTGEVLRVDGGLTT